MQDVILLVSTSAIFIFGYFMVKKLDAFLENNWNEQEHALIHGENSLKIGFSNPLMADSLSDVLRCTAVVMIYAGLSIEPIAENHITQKALWRNSKKTPVIDSFIGCMNRLAVNQSQM